MLQNFGINLILEIENKDHLQKVKQNLQSFCLAINNMNGLVRAQELPDMILKAHLKQVNSDIPDREKIVID
mgnify:CR=1 FL=1